MTLLRVLHPYLYVPVPILPNALLPYVQAPGACAYLKFTGYAYRFVPSSHQRCPALVRVRIHKYATRTTVCTGARCVRVPEIAQNTRTDSYHRPNKTRGSYCAMTLLLYEYCTRTGTYRYQYSRTRYSTTVCTGARCVRVPESTNDTRTGSYHHPNNTQGSYFAMSPRQRVLRVLVLHSSKDYVQATHAYSTPAILATRLHGLYICISSTSNPTTC